MRVDLQDGFSNDRVELYANGVMVFAVEEVTTRRQLGFASSSEVDLPEETVKLEIRIPTRSLSKTISVDSSNIGISLRNGQIEVITSGKRFGYA